MRKKERSPEPSSNPPSYEELRQNLSSLIDSKQDHSTSTRLCSSDKSECRNIPYRPSKNIQAHINRLLSATPLEISASGTETEYFDLLPSFQLYQSILKRNDFEFDENSLGNPPLYGDYQRSSVRTDGNSRSDQMPRAPLRIIDLDDHQMEAGYRFTADEDNDGVEQNTHDMHDHPQISQLDEPHNRGELSHESYGTSVLDNIDKLPIARYSPLTIQIFVTKNVPRPNEPNELENKLKEYSCGDIVNGYVIINNTSHEDIDFGLFVVSLEGTVKALPQDSRENDAGKPPSKFMLKKFLKMYDLNASYNYGVIPSSAGIQYDANSRDHYDGCILGLPDDRVLKAGEKYKKFITFKFPEMLLDNACPHDVMRHTMPPPSFGTDERFLNGQSLEVNKALGYGTSSVRGSPIKVRDFSFDNLSVSYAIEAKFIDKENLEKLEKLLNGDESRYVVSKKSQFFLRFVPDVKAQVEAYSRAYRDFKEETFEKIGIDGMFFNQLTSSSTWNTIHQMNKLIEDEIKSETTALEESSKDQKRIWEGSPSRSIKTSKDQFSNLSSQLVQEREVESHATTIFAKKRKRLLPVSSAVGELRMAVQIPDKLIPYVSPRLLQKYNQGNPCSQLQSLSIQGDKNALAPVSSNMEELYNRDDAFLMNSVLTKITFLNNETIEKPPGISHIDFNIVAWTYRTEYPLPLSLEHDLFYSNPASSLRDRNFTFIDTHENLLILKDRINLQITNLRDKGTLLSQRTFSYLKGISKLGVKKDTIQNFFEPINFSSSLDSLQYEWTATETHNKRLEWRTELTLPLKISNKHNYTLVPSFQNCLVGRLYALQIIVKLKGAENGTNEMKVEVPVLVG